jgi:hypothetical protein
MFHIYTGLQILRLYAFKSVTDVHFCIIIFRYLNMHNITASEQTNTIAGSAVYNIRHTKFNNMFHRTLHSSCTKKREVMKNSTVA